MNKIRVIHHSNTQYFKPEKEFFNGELVNHFDKPERVASILNEINKHDFLSVINTSKAPLDPSTVHEDVLIRRFSDSRSMTGEQLYNVDQKDHLCIDSYTPLNNKLAKGLDASLSIINEAICQHLQGHSVYALSRPPGHHSSESTYGGYCYYNYTALAAHALSEHGKVAVLDIDFHHGNGTQDIFYKRDDVLTISIHADPKKHFPHTGYEEELGDRQGLGFNRNYILAEKATIDLYEKTMIDALKEMKEFNPEYTIISFGADTYINDPLGAFNIETSDYKKMSQTISQYFKPVLVIQEGGYHVADLGKNVVSFLSGLSR